MTSEDFDYDSDDDVAGVGHNSGKADVQVIAASELRSLIERIERLEEEKKAYADDIKEVYAEAKGRGFDTKTMRTIVRLRKKDKAEREEEAAMTELYLSALGML